MKLKILQRSLHSFPFVEFIVVVVWCTYWKFPSLVLCECTMKVGTGAEEWAGAEERVLE